MRAHLVLSGRGWGPHVGAIQSVVEKVHHAPVEDISELRSRYAALDLYLCTSTLEGGPLPVLEALACSVPVVSTPVGHVRELVVADSSNGMVVEADPSRLSSAIVAVLGQAPPCPDPRISESVMPWSWDVLGGQYRSCYLEAVARARCERRLPIGQALAVRASIAGRRLKELRGTVKRRVVTLA